MNTEKLVELPSSPHEPTGFLVSGHVDHSEIFVAGFRDCAEEAIKYLIEVERLSPDDPVILGLQHYLLERQQQLDALGHVNGDVIDNTGHVTAEDGVIRCPLTPSSMSAKCPCDGTFLSDSSGIISDEASSYFDSSPTLPSTLERDCYVDLMTSSCEDTQNFEGIEELTDPSKNLIKLAENDLAFASVTKELFELLSQEYFNSDDDDDDDDDDDYDDDDNNVEMTT